MFILKDGVWVVIGAQWGDEGKGKIIDVLSEEADVVARFQGGANAGHTVVIGGQKHILHLVPSGILRPKMICVLGNGVVIDPSALFNEIYTLDQAGIRVQNRLLVSNSAHVVMSYHKTLDELGSQGRIGTTGRGIGPAYADKTSRLGIRVGDLFRPSTLTLKIRQNLQEINPILIHRFGRRPLEEQSIAHECQGYAGILSPYACADVSNFFNNELARGARILAEGAQGTMLDLDLGTYPYVTSSNPTAGGACTGLGIGPTKIDHVLGVIKAYTTRVGHGPFPTELYNIYGEWMRDRGGEVGATTGRPRRCGWFDAVVANYAVQVNGITAWAVTKLDVLDTFEEIKVCTAYRYCGKETSAFPTDIQMLEECVPVYKTFPGWKQSTAMARRFEELPQRAQDYLTAIEDMTGITIEIISVGPDREQTIHYV